MIISAAVCTEAFWLVDGSADYEMIGLHVDLYALTFIFICGDYT